jgi:hypothetical protein
MVDEVLPTGKEWHMVLSRSCYLNIDKGEGNKPIIISIDHPTFI